MRVNVTKEKWDFLVILDACRYDYFERNYKDFFKNGHLTLRQTLGTSTNEWRDLTFVDYYKDIIYLSANPYISNSLVDGFDGSKHFYKVFNIWETHWDKYRGTVLPESMTSISIEKIKQYPNMRFIIHYIQPHSPYLTPSIVSCGYTQGNIDKDRQLIGYKYNRLFYNKRLSIWRFLLNHTGFLNKFTNRRDWYLRQLLGLPPHCAMDSLRRKHGKKTLMKAYEMNLRYALEAVRDLASKINGKLVITADHGELLGEKRNYGHPSHSNDPILTEVPWFEVDCQQNNEIDRNADNQIQSKLKSLGYID
jgi:hypothetical protein